MAVDEKELADMITLLQTKIQANGKERGILRTLQEDAIGICKKEVPDPTSEEPERKKMIMPMDKTLGAEMKVPRRDEIFEKIKADIAKL